MVYSRQGLPEPGHKIEAPLEPVTEYFWSVRARFELDGQTRVTPWSAALGDPAEGPLQLPRPSYFRFKTPPRPSPSRQGADGADIIRVQVGR